MDTSSGEQLCLCCARNPGRRRCCCSAGLVAAERAEREQVGDDGAALSEASQDAEASPFPLRRQGAERGRRKRIIAGVRRRVSVEEERRGGGHVIKIRIRISSISATASEGEGDRCDDRGDIRRLGPEHEGTGSQPCGGRKH